VCGCDWDADLAHGALDALDVAQELFGEERGGDFGHHVEEFGLVEVADGLRFLQMEEVWRP
jgi:hypothetical protein